METKLILSTLPKTWIFDLDGTLLKHNGYKLDGEDSMLEGAKEYLDSLPKDFLDRNAVRYDDILFEMPMGERIIVNDRKPSGIDMAVAVNCDRDRFYIPEIVRVK